MKDLHELSSSGLADKLAELDQAIEDDQGMVASVRRRIKNNSRQREQILDLLSLQACRRGWR